MRTIRAVAGSLLLVLLAGAGLALGAVGWRVHVTTAARTMPPEQLRLDALRVRTETVRFQASDGLSLNGLLIRGRPGMPPVILCHDLGARGSSLINLGLALHAEGFPVLLFDFRAHGESDGRYTTLGMDEKRDVLGAVDFLVTRPELDHKRLGVFGVGMGAHAAVLAAADRPALRVLVLDDLYPDVSYPLLRGTFPDWEFGSRHLAVLPRAIFGLMRGAQVGDARAADVLGRLPGRDLLLLAPERDVELAGAMRAMYDTISDGPDADGNLVYLSATQGQGVYGDDFVPYTARVTAFFAHRLARQ